MIVKRSDFQSTSPLPFSFIFVTLRNTVLYSVRDKNESLEGSRTAVTARPTTGDGHLLISFAYCLTGYLQRILLRLVWSLEASLSRVSDPTTVKVFRLVYDGAFVEHLHRPELGENVGFVVITYRICPNRGTYTVIT